MASDLLFCVSSFSCLIKLLTMFCLETAAEDNLADFILLATAFRDYLSTLGASIAWQGFDEEMKSMASAHKALYC